MIAGAASVSKVTSKTVQYSESLPIRPYYDYQELCKKRGLQVLENHRMNGAVSRGDCG